nr:bolA-like protein 3 isoform X1 [Saimiri boliviensis boliviensis]
MAAWSPAAAAPLLRGIRGLPLHCVRRMFASQTEGELRVTQILKENFPRATVIKVTDISGCQSWSRPQKGFVQLPHFPEEETSPERPKDLPSSSKGRDSGIETRTGTQGRFCPKPSYQPQPGSVLLRQPLAPRSSGWQCVRSRLEEQLLHPQDGEDRPFIHTHMHTQNGAWRGLLDRHQPESLHTQRQALPLSIATRAH